MVKSFLLLHFIYFAIILQPAAAFFQHFGRGGPLQRKAAGVWCVVNAAPASYCKGDISAFVGTSGRMLRAAIYAALCSYPGEKSLRLSRSATRIDYLEDF